MRQRLCRRRGSRSFLQDMHDHGIDGNPGNGNQGEHHGRNVNVASGPLCACLFALVYGCYVLSTFVRLAPSTMFREYLVRNQIENSP